MSSLISVVMPHFNSVKYVKESIDSVIGQSYENWELLIVDDHSDYDQYMELVQLAGTDARIKLIRLGRNSGAAVARNKAIMLAKGRYIAFLDCDDLWLPNKLEQQIGFMRAAGVYFSYASYEIIHENGGAFSMARAPYRVAYNDLLKTNSIGCLTAIYDAEVLGKLYMPLIRMRQDLGLWLKILKNIPYAYATPGVLAKYRVRHDSISAKKRIAAWYTWRLYRDVEGFGLVLATYYFVHYVMLGCLKRILPGAARILGVFKFR